ncbi:MAG: glycosyltransferase family 4 protein [candidate division WOR-3 bacterium]
MSIKVLFLSDPGTGDTPSGPQRFARGFVSGIKGLVDLTHISLREESKLSRVLACLGRYDIYHVSGVSFLEPVAAALRAGSRLLYTAHGTVAGEMRLGYRYPVRLLWAERLLLRRARFTVAVSETLRQRIGGEYPFADNKVIVIPPPIDPALLESEPEDPGFPRPYILFPGSGPTKGLAHALRAFEMVRDRIPRISLVVISEEQGPKPPGVIWSEPLPTRTLIGAYAEAELVLNTSDYETFGLPVVEAAALGKPFLVSKGSGASEYARKEFPELVVDPEDHEALATKILGIMRNPPPRDALRAWAGRFSAQRVAEEYMRLYREVCLT